MQFEVDDGGGDVWDGVSAGGEGRVAPVLHGVECGGAELRRAADDVGVGDGAVAIGTNAPQGTLTVQTKADDLGDGLRIQSADAATTNGYLILNKNAGLNTRAVIKAGDNVEAQLDKEKGAIKFVMKQEPKKREKKSEA